MANETILVVDDDEQVSRLLVRILETAGYRCVAARNGAETADILEAETFAVALVDLLLGPESGLGLAEQILERSPTTAVLILTVIDDQEMARMALDLGVSGYLLKPFTPNEILINVANALRRRELEMEFARNREGLELLVKKRTSELEAKIADLQVAQEDLADAEERYRGLFENSLVGIFRTTKRGRFLIANPALARMLGYETPDQMIAEVSAPDLYLDQEQRRALLRTLRERGSAHEFEAVLRSRDGTPVVLSMVITAIRDESGRVVGMDGGAIDITEGRKAKEDLDRTIEVLRATDEHRRRLLGHVVVAQEQERKRIADDIHDDSIQAITAVGMRLHLLKDRLSAPEDVAALERLQEIVSLSISRLRNLLFQLVPPGLDHLGLEMVLRDHLEAMSAVAGFAFELRAEYDEEPSPATKVILFRLAQEALVNVEKHSQARTVRVEVQGEIGGFSIRIVDDGVGFVVGPDATPHGHLGLAAMEQRAEMAGGTLRVTSSPGAGTVVECFIPAEHGEQAPPVALAASR